VKTVRSQVLPRRTPRTWAPRRRRRRTWRRRSSRRSGTITSTTSPAKRYGTPDHLVRGKKVGYLSPPPTLQMTVVVMTVVVVMVLLLLTLVLLVLMLRLRLLIMTMVVLTTSTHPPTDRRAGGGALVPGLGHFRGQGLQQVHLPPRPPPQPRRHHHPQEDQVTGPRPDPIPAVTCRGGCTVLYVAPSRVLCSCSGPGGQTAVTAGLLSCPFIYCLPEFSCGILCGGRATRFRGSGTFAGGDFAE
jgi:hypothetical protein